MLALEAQISAVSLEEDLMLLSQLRTLTSTDSKEQLEEFNKTPEKYTQYARDIEGELNKRFTLVCLPSPVGLYYY